MISVVVPLGGSDPARARAWEHVRRRYEGHEVVVAEMGDSKAAAVNEGVRRASGDVLVIADADSFISRPVAEVESLARRAGWCVPFAAICRLDAAGTQAVLAGAEPDRRRLARSPYAAKPGGGIVAVTRESFETVSGFDERFVGWGGEDQAFGWALEALVGEPARLPGPLWHLWHEPAGKMSAENRALALRYRTARTRPAAMRVLLAEFTRPAVISSGGGGRPGGTPLGSVS